MIRLQARLATVVLVVSMGAAALAAEEEPPVPSELVEEIVVSETVAKERQDPASFTDLDAEQIKALHVGQDLSTLLGDTVNAYSYSDAGNGFGYSYLRIRGFDQTRIAVNVNGVPLNTPESHQVYTIDLGDLAAGLGLIQIQRGPGTALYGSPAVGGVVNLEMAPLGTSPGGSVELEAGSFGTGRVAFRYGGPLGSGPWAWAIRAAHVRSDGYRDPSWSRQSLLQLAFERLDPASTWRVLLFGGPEETQLAYFGVPYEYLADDTLRRTNVLVPGETDTFVQPQLQVINDRRIAPGLFLKNTVYAIVGEGYFRQFSPALDYDPLGPDAPPSSSFPEATVEDAWRKRALGNRQVGWIPRVAWSHKSGELTAGLELLFHRGRHDGKVTEGAVCQDPGCTSTADVDAPLILYDFTNRKDTLNLFVREAWRVTPKVTLQAELQGTRHRMRMGDDEVRGFSWDGTYDFLSPRLGVNWNVTDRWNVYGQATSTRSEPTFNNVWDPEDPATDPAARFARYDPGTNRYSDPLAKPERLRSYEVGAGYVAGTTRIKMNLYRMDFRDEFVYAGGVDSDGLPLTTNAGRSLHEGIEIAGSGRLPWDLDVSGYLALSHDVLEEYEVLSPDGFGGTIAIDYSGNRIALFPDRTARLEIARAFGPVRLQLWGRHVGRIYIDNSENERKTPAHRDVPGYVNKDVDPFTLVGFQVVTDLSRLVKRIDGSLSVRVRLDNLLDARVAQFGYAYPLDAAYTQFYSEFFPSATRSVLVGVSFGF